MSDWELLAISRNRDVLRDAVRFRVADATLVENLVDKARFARLAARHELPRPSHDGAAGGRIPWRVRLSFPTVLTPFTRRGTSFTEISGGAKAMLAGILVELDVAASALATAGLDALG